VGSGRHIHQVPSAPASYGKSFTLNPNGCLPIDVWSLPCANTAARHYAAFPESLVEQAIRACSNPGDLVLDPFVGSGTTCAVAVRLGRRCLGIDLNPEYVKLASRAARSALLQLRHKCVIQQKASSLCTVQVVASPRSM
jgi:DNA modification methylase